MASKYIYKIILIFLLLLTQGVYAQTLQDDLFYKDASIKRELVKCEEMTLVCDTLNDFTICVYDSEDNYWGKEVDFIDGTQWNRALLFGKRLYVLHTKEQARNLHLIVDNAFTKDMVEELNGQMLITTVDIHSSDGSVAGVGFMFEKGDAYEKIPIDVYCTIIREIKENFIFELSDLGKKLNYNTISWLQCPRGREESNTSTIEESGKLTMPDGGLNSTAGSVGNTVGLQ